MPSFAAIPDRYVRMLAAVLYFFCSPGRCVLQCCSNIILYRQSYNRY